MDEPAKVVSGVAVSTTLIVPKEYKQIGCSRGGIAHRKSIAAGTLPLQNRSQQRE